MAKKKKWWFNEDTDQSVLFPNTVKQHKENMGAPVYSQGELLNDYEYDYEADYYGWNRKSEKGVKDNNEVSEEEYVEIQNEVDKLVSSNTSQQDYDRMMKERIDAKLKAKKALSNFNDEWESKWSSGKWEGYSYYRTPQLTYRYVQQMANALAAQHKIDIKIGNEWICDLKTKTLTYNPASLVYSTKSELLATLLHEIGKLRYSKSLDELKYDDQGKPLSPYLDKYGAFAYNAMTPFEELRIDTKMLGEYGSAGEIYESQEPSLMAVYKNYKKLSQNVKRFIADRARQVFEGSIQNASRNHYDDMQTEIMVRAKLLIMKGVKNDDAIAQAINEIQGDPRKVQPQSNSAKMMAMFGVPTEQEARAKFDQMVQKIMAKDTLYDYIASVYSEAYLLRKDKDFTPEMQERLAKTVPSFKPIVGHNDTKEVVAEMNANVYPVIEDLLKDMDKGFSELGEFGGKDFQNNVNQELQRAIAQMQAREGAGTDKGGNQKVRLSPKSSGQTNDTTVPEWFNGDYKTLKDSVRSEIARLTRMLTFLRRTEQTTKWVGNQRRGRLNMKKLYRAKMGNRRVFKSKLETQDTVKSFAFSLILDVSGSMQGSRIANTTRGMVILAEVFKDMGIPFEIITFSDGAKVIKKFETEMSKEVEGKIGGLPKFMDGGGTNLDQGLKKMKLKERPERNKVAIVLTDGGVGDADMYNQKYFNPMWKNDHIKSLAFGLEISEREISKLCNGTGKAIKNAVEVPYVFADLLKSLILKK